MYCFFSSKSFFLIVLNFDFPFVEVWKPWRGKDTHFFKNEEMNKLVVQLD